MTEEKVVRVEGFPHSPSKGRNNTLERLWIGSTNDMSGFLVIPEKKPAVVVNQVKPEEVVQMNKSSKEVSVEEKVQIEGGRNKKMVTGCEGDDCFDIKDMKKKVLDTPVKSVMDGNIVGQLKQFSELQEFQCIGFASFKQDGTDVMGAVRCKPIEGVCPTVLNADVCQVMPVELDDLSKGCLGQVKKI